MGLDPASMAIDATTKGWANAINLITSIKQHRLAKKMEAQNPRPVMGIPGAIQANQNVAEQQAAQGMPGQQYTNAQQNIANSANRALSQARNRRSGLAAIGAIQQGTNNATLNLDTQDANMRMNNIRNLVHQNNITGQYQQHQWRYNSAQKYAENANAIRALKTGANANLNTALNNTFSDMNLLAENNGVNFNSSHAAPPPARSNVNWFENALPYNDFKIPR